MDEKTRIMITDQLIEDFPIQITGSEEGLYALTYYKNIYLYDKAVGQWEKLPKIPVK
jgi:hypothetical protein